MGIPHTEKDNFRKRLVSIRDTPFLKPLTNPSIFMGEFWMPSPIPAPFLEKFRKLNTLLL